MENQIKNKTNEPISLTVVVLDSKSMPTEGARVSITPSDASSITNTMGEVIFKLGNDTKYQITASSGNKTVTVPYYVTENGATRLVVNPTYVRTIEKQLHPYAFKNFGVVTYVGIAIVILLIIFFIYRTFRRKRAVSRHNQ
jgi:hypothetical protein